EVFVIKLSADGTRLEYGVLFPGTEGRSIAVDAGGNAYVVGETRRAGLPTTPSAVKPDFGATDEGADAFLVKINPTGSALVFGTYLGGSKEDTAHSVVSDGFGGAVVVGEAASDDFVGIAGAAAGLSDAFALHVSADGSAILAGRRFGGLDSEYAAAVS